MRHPLDFIPIPSRKRIFIVLLIWTLILFAVMQVLGNPLKTAAAPAGIVSFELADTPENAAAITASWDTRTGLFAALGLGFDYLLMPTYAIAIALATLLAAGRHPGSFANIGAWLGWGIFLAAILDATENLALWQILLGGANSFWPMIAFWCASFKFGLILLGIAYGLVGWILPKEH